MLDPRSRRRTATVVAAEDLTVKVFNRREFGTLPGPVRPSPSRSGGTPGSASKPPDPPAEDLVESVGVDEGSEVRIRILGFFAVGEGKDSLDAVGMDD